MKLLSVVMLAFSITTVESGFAHPSVETRLGTVLGQRRNFSSRFLKESVEIHYFLGIPYARPPIDEMRFRQAEPTGPFEGVYNATEVPPSCIQERRPYFEHLSAGSTYSEDCLYLNIFVPATAPPNATVMVFIHGGLFEWGSGSDFPHNPFPLVATGNVIVVTFNFRLNIFGFLTSGDTAIPPNIALTDQQLALKWVNENIAAFGGDPSKVTIFGEGSGAVSVGWHLLSPSSRGYFQRAVLQSGNPLESSAELISRETAFKKIQAVADFADCKPPNPENTTFIADCLRLKTVDELLDLQNQLQFVYPTERLFDPVVDGVFFPKNISDLLEDGLYNDVDVLLGTTRDVGIFLAYSLFNFPTEKPFVDKAAFSVLSAGINDSVTAALLGAIYSDSIVKEGNYFDALADAVGDARSTCRMTDFAIRVQGAGSNVFMYYLTQVPTRSIWNFSTGDVTHFDDLQFIFGVPFQDNLFSIPSYEEVKVSFYVMRMWTNFAKSGDPNRPALLPKNIGKWPKFSSDSKSYKELDINFSNKSNLREYYCIFWDYVLPLLLRVRGNSSFLFKYYLKCT
ncbi:Acetylcholinesterase [Holothuria leucospilota]|uniref:Acetylcholinesterase n=1 Tax=Holothuria leucospilota TaxID=206669 RepID=A0A9Q1BRT1_HOLLE|nr:Acetylcholinesterase [Holothuria leucospilota]